MTFSLLLFLEPKDDADFRGRLPGSEVFFKKSLSVYPFEILCHLGEI